MSQTYTYSQESDFKNGLKQDQLQSEIKSSAITVEIYGITTYGDTVNIIFASSLSPSEITILNGLITAHTPIYLGNKQITSEIKFGEVISTTYTVYLSYQFPGDSIISNITHIRVSGYMSEGTSYTIRLVDYTNNNIIAYGTFSNQTVASNELTNMSNIPANPAIFEVQCKVNDTSTKASITSMSIYYN